MVRRLVDQFVHPVTDIRALIAETLRTHYLWPEGQDGSEHLADVLLSLLGIAVVELPQGTRYVPTSPIVMFPQGVRGDVRGRVLIGTGPLEPERARTLAAALLAAANVADGVK